MNPNIKYDKYQTVGRFTQFGFVYDAISPDDNNPSMVYPLLGILVVIVLITLAITFLG